MDETYIVREEFGQSTTGRLLASWVVSILGIWLSDLLGLLSFGDEFVTLIVAGLVLAFLNTFIRPILNFLSIPFIIVTLGFFMLIVSAFTLWITSEIVREFELDGFWSTIGAAIILAILNSVVGGALRGPSVKTEVHRIDE
jgi:putative membrane protein